MATIILIGIFLLPVILLTLLKVNGILVYLSLCLGAVLATYVGNNSNVNHFISTTHVVSSQLNNNNNIKIALLLLPAVLTIIFFINTAKGSKISINLLTAIAVGILTVTLLVPLLPFNNSASIVTTPLWGDFSRYQAAIIGASSALIVVMMLLQRSKFGSGSKHHKHKS
jgi:hypothetical protein